MAILKIARMGHKVLSYAAEAVNDPEAPSVQRLVQDMIETMEDSGGIGLSAPQVHVSKRVVIFHVPENRVLSSEQGGKDGEKDVGNNLNDDSNLIVEAVPMTILINPEVKAIDKEVEFGVEGCLSLPGMLGMVPRYKRIRYKGFTPDGSEIHREASGFHARVVQHECDHLDGVLYPMRMTDLSTFGYSEEISSSGNLLLKDKGINDNG